MVLAVAMDLIVVFYLTARAGRRHREAGEPKRDKRISLISSSSSSSLLFLSSMAFISAFTRTAVPSLSLALDRLSLEPHRSVQLMVGLLGSLQAFGALQLLGRMVVSPPYGSGVPRNRTKRIEPFFFPSVSIVFDP